MCTIEHDLTSYHFLASPSPAVEAETESRPKPALTLFEADEVKITLVVENTFDMLLTSSEHAKRFKLHSNLFERPLPTAEHGYSALISVKSGNRHGSILFDTGVSKRGFLYNLDVLEINPADFSAVILSHGHPDHALGLPGLVERLGERRLPLILHPDAFLERKLILPNGDEIQLPPPKQNDYRQENIEILMEPTPSALIDNLILISGEVARTTGFEQGFPVHYARRDGKWEPDPLIHDDQCAIINLREKGLVIVTGCGHSGIINIIRNARAITGIEKIHAVIGGFHLSGALFEKIIPQTVEELTKIGPKFIVPGHCTGWIATHQIARNMPDAFIPSSAGTTFLL
jgi:7,8-dihydropterin-6-yl-methyl-4-(beta-D-ribofuranosyl)aminobenzene 5'-phosphate synthase